MVMTGLMGTIKLVISDKHLEWGGGGEIKILHKPKLMRGYNLCRNSGRGGAMCKSGIFALQRRSKPPKNIEIHIYARYFSQYT